MHVYIRSLNVFIKKMFQEVTSQLPLLTIIFIMFPLWTNQFHFLNDKTFNLLFDAKKMSRVVAIFWLLNFAVCIVAHAESRKVRMSDLGPKPKGNCSTGQAAQARIIYSKPNKDPTPNAPASISLCLWNPVAASLNSICWTKWRDQSE